MTRPPPRSYAVRNYGCQMNMYDGARMAELLDAQGLSEAAVGEADLVVLNTCHIREKAAEKVYSEIGRLKRADGSRPMIAVAGCVAQAEGGEVSRRAREVNIVVGPQAYHDLPAMIASAAAGRKSIGTDLPGLAKFAALPARRRTGASAFLTVQEGCDKFCTYCVVPYTRGAEISRAWSAIVEEARLLIDGGAVEITLLGQNVNAWTGEDERGRPHGLDGLLRALDRLPGLRRLRYTTSHPGDMTEGLIAAHGEVATLMPFLHLPVQSGSDRVLQAMNRKHRADAYLRIVERVRVARPDIALSSDFIVGFPGESEAEFDDTLRLVEAAQFAGAYTFKYSPRPGTPAAETAKQIPAQLMNERLAALQALIGRQQLAFNAASIGRRTEVLIERPGRRPGQRIGRSPWMQSVHLETDGPIGSMLEVEIVSAGPVSVGGQLHHSPAKAGAQLNRKVWVPAFAGGQSVAA